MTSVNNAEQSPNDVLAEQVVKQLAAAGLIASSKVDEILMKVKTGTATSEDWTLWIDLGQVMQAEDKNGASG
jgi:hypothetical protein